MDKSSNELPRDGSTPPKADLIITGAKIATQDERRSFAQAVAIKEGRFLAVGTEAAVQAHRGPHTKVIDAAGRTMIPGLNDSHLHLIRGGLSYNLELRWDGVPSLADALRMLKEQAQRTPVGQWVRVIGGWGEFQFAERRMPTLAEINAAAPETPVFVLHLYDRALLNRAALRALGYDRNTPAPPAGIIEKDAQGNPTGLLLAAPNATVLYTAIAAAPKLPLEYQINSTKQFMSEMNRLGITSIVDAGGGFQSYPEDYAVMSQLHVRGEMTVRIAYNLFTQHNKGEFADFEKWTQSVKLGGDHTFRVNGAGEMLTYSAADFEDFLQPRPDLPSTLEPDLTQVVRLLVEKRWPFRLHATYDESISRFLDIFEAVNRDVPFNHLRWFFDHAETISPRNIDRVKALGGGIAIQNRMAFQGEYFIERYGAKAAEATPPITRMLATEIPIGAGTDGTRVSSYNPFVCLYWMISGRTVGGTAIYPEAQRLDRMEALRRYTVGSAWFSGEETIKGAIVPGQLADFALLTSDYFTISEEEIKHLESVLTVMDGKIVYAAQEFANLGPPPLPVLPEWSPVARFGGYYNPRTVPHAACGHSHNAIHRHAKSPERWLKPIRDLLDRPLWSHTGPFDGGCSCWSF